MPELALELLPERSTTVPDDAVVVEVRGMTRPGTVTVHHLGEEVLRREVPPTGRIDLGALPAGGYGVELRCGDGVARTAVEVTADPRARLRYGFVASYRPDRDPTGLADTVRRLHLTGVQFYDWAYRHADLVGGGEEYRDALDQPISLATVRRLVAAVQGAGADALGYAAVYAVGPEEWPTWEHAALVHSDGTPWALGDFLFLVDPVDAGWLEHLSTDLAASVEQVGFDGFHLDQYGYPRLAVRRDGTRVDVAESFVGMLDGLRAALPTARLVFNNVNDFPTWRTASAPQDAVYIEVWEPHVTLGDLARVVTRARHEGQGKPVAIAAYQHVYSAAPATEADVATALTMATLYSHGATQLLAGEDDRVLVDPYYVRNHPVEPTTAQMLRRWYDFLVEHDEILMAPGVTDVTGAWLGAYNETVEVTHGDVRASTMPEPGAVWTRATEVDGRLVLHLVNLAGQDDTLWDGPKRPPAAVGSGVLRVRRVGATLPRVRVADPDRSARLVDVAVRADGDVAVAELPEPHVWQVVVVDW
nr:glycoside hydrolase family 66 protein [Cellulomonas sp. APG4]